MRSARASQTARWPAIHASAWASVFGLSSQVRTRPVLLERMTPLFSSTERCFMNDGSAIANGAASVDTDAGPPAEHADDRLPGGVGQGVEHVRQRRRLVSHWLSIRPSAQSAQAPFTGAVLPGRRRI